MNKCFFCEKIIIPKEIITTNEICNFFKDNNMEFTLNYTRSRRKIGKKDICLICEDEIRDISNTTFECNGNCEQCTHNH